MDEALAMLCREHDAATGGDKVTPGQRWRDADGAMWIVGAIVSGMERTALLTGPDDSTLHIPAATLATLYERIDHADV